MKECQVSNMASPSVSAPTEINLEPQEKLLMTYWGAISRLSSFFVRYPFRQRLPKSWSPLFCLQVHQLGGCFCWSADPFYHSSPQSITSQGEVTMWHFWLWIPSRWGGCHSQSKGQRFCKRESFFGPFVLLSSSCLECEPGAQRSSSYPAMRKQLIQGWKRASC